MSHIKVIPLALLGEHPPPPPHKKRKKVKMKVWKTSCFLCCQITKMICFQASVEKWRGGWEKWFLCFSLLLSSFAPRIQAPPSRLSWTAHLTTSIWASALISVSPLLAFTWSIQVEYSASQSALFSNSYIETTWTLFSLFFFQLSVWSRVRSRRLRATGYDKETDTWSEMSCSFHASRDTLFRWAGRPQVCS